MNDGRGRPRWAFIHPFQLRLQRGIETYLWGLAPALTGCGVELDILTWSGPLKRPDYVDPAVKLRAIPAVRYCESTWAVPHYVSGLWRHHYDHVFIHFAGYGEGAALRAARILMEVPHSAVFHYPPSLVPHRYRELRRWGVDKSAEHLIAVSRATAAEVEAWAGRPCSVIGHGVDTQRFRPDAALRAQTRQMLGIAADAPVLVTVAALEERKGVQWVIRALPALLKEHPELKYMVVGDGPYRGELCRLAEGLGLEQQVQFMGARLDVRPYLCAADVMMVLARGEASSISLLEGLACGLPAITSCCEPFPELVRPEWGEMVDEQDADAVAGKIVALLADAVLRTARGSNGRRWASGRHSWVQAAEEYLKLCREDRRQFQEQRT